MKYNYFIPHNLEVDKLLYENPPNFKPYKKEKLLYILSLINQLILSNKDIVYNTFTYINAKVLKEYVDNYKDYLNYLINDLEIIESDNRYIPGEKSKGFRFIDKYQTTVKPHKVMDFVMRKKMKVSQNKALLTVGKLNYLTKWFDEGLEIDFNKCYQFLQQEYELKRRFIWLRDYDVVKKKYKIPIHQFNRNLIAASSIDNKDYFLKRDDNVYRFHSNLTNINSKLRNVISYKGEQLVSLDITNSQPYISTLLFNKDFWRKKKKVVAKQGQIINNILNIQQLPNNYIYYIMLGEMAASLDNKGFVKYVSLVKDGLLYEYLQEKFKTELGLDIQERKQLKAAVFQTLFTSNNFIGQEEAAPKRLFVKLFPEVYTVFKQIKKKDKTLLPRLLQSIESYLMIDVVSKRIAKEHPEAPIFTIHDSIATTKKYVDKVREIVEEECIKAIGFAPKLKEEYWDVKNMDNYINDLKKKVTKYVA